ncbi:hypothetical protein BDV23DRAFT_155518 [Aspergillus alliaceus]|uniref:Major facilitator superfamily domain-containing protein n=1 Tax=Petromyces alliaceus TaxID=209559 RepID=A0A5N7C935_PETAA|nr:hypothetical protein BDV23DRAFT_155518 [Aspergillus alliaceus]
MTALLSGRSAAVNVELIGSIKDAARLHAAKEAFALSLRNMWIPCAYMAGIGILACTFITKITLKTELQKQGPG